MARLGGEPGVGKTRLARELMEGAAPYVPFVEMIEQSVHLVPQAVRAAVGEVAPEIAAIVPSLRRTYPDIPPLLEVPADQQRRLIFGGFLECIRRGTQKSPVVYLLDDLHWADESTQQLLQHLASHLASMRLLIVGTYRDVELDVARPFTALPASASRAGWAADRGAKWLGDIHD